LSTKALLNVQVWSRLRLSMSEIRDTEFVRALLLPPIDLHRSSPNQTAMHIKCSDHSGLVAIHCGVHVLQCILRHEERPFHCAVVTPEPHRASCVIAAAVIWKDQGHDIMRKTPPH
jgi:hypothetical protein